MFDSLKKTLAQSKTWLILLAAAFAVGGTFGALIKPFDREAVQQKTVEVTFPDAGDVAAAFAPGGMGWIDSPSDTEAVRKSLPEGEKSFGETPAGKAVLGIEQDVVLSEVVKKCRGAFLPARDQGNLGCCVSFGTATAIEYLLYNQIARGDRLKFRDLCNEVLYGGSRVQIGGNHIRGDGSVTAWAGQFVHNWGIVGRDVYGERDLTKYDVSRCRQWGDSGVPQDILAVAKNSPVKGITFANSADEVAKSLRQQYTLAIGSKVGFGNSGPYTRDADGFLLENGKWGHCQAIIGVKGGARPGFLIMNSWGPNWVGGPKGQFDIPPGSYWIDWKTMDKMTKEGDCIVFSDATGFPQRKAEWDIRIAPPFRRQPLDLLALAF